ncbi:hemagglutinin [Cupriavidus sp. amp6]|uniref:M30 family zinc metallopeptidase n=1 Tax=Cupriavidus sp. amp6 TaxID=388051 RepID=UPI0004914C04|nr:hemagglutinin [Cupriavidus sp. amp6]
MTYKQRVLHFFRSLAQAALISIMLASCGGDGDDPPASPEPQTMTTTTAASVPVEKSCSNCGALDAHTYSGSGIGVWESVNSTSSAVEVPISISGLNGQEVTLVFTNQTGTPQVMPTIAVAARNYSFVAEQLRLDDSTEALKRRISNFNRDGWRVHAKEQSYAPRYSLSPSRLDNGSVKIWYLADDTTRSTTLVRKLMTADGTIVNFWVETTELDPTKVSQAVLDTLAGDFVSPGKIYDMLNSIGGPVWGPHSYSDLISGHDQPIDIVIAKFTKGSEMAGYFYARNAIKRESEPYSNESVSLYLNSEEMYQSGTYGLNYMRSAMAHEAMHMQNFYRRGISKGPEYQFEIWLEEATAMMFEDFVSQTIEKNFNTIRDVRFTNYVRFGGRIHNCSLFDWDKASTCNGYSIWGTLGGFLNRQLGLSFYKHLLTNVSSTDSMAVLESSVRDRAANSSFQQELRHFAATSGALMKEPAPVGFGFPLREEGGFVLPEINAGAFLNDRSQLSMVPAELHPYANVPVVREHVKGMYSETVKIPPHSSLSVVIQ